MEHQAMELLTTRVEDEKQNVTYKWLSRSLGISVNTAKELMQVYLTTVGKNKAHGTYYLARQDPATGNQHLSLVSQEELKTAQKDASVVGYHIYSLEPSPLKDLAILSAINSEATQLQKGKDINLYRVVRNHHVVISASNYRPTPATSSSSAFAAKPKAGAAQSAPGLSGAKPGLNSASSAPAAAASSTSSTTTTNDTSKTTTSKSAAPAAKGSMMSFFGKASGAGATKAASAPTPAKPAAKTSSTLNFKPAASAQQKRKADLMTGAVADDMSSPRATRSNEESEEDEVDSEEERDRRLALSSRLDQDQGDIVEKSQNKSASGNHSPVDVESIKKKQRSARLLAVDDDDDLDADTARAVTTGRRGGDDDDGESVEVMSKEARAALNKEKEAQRLALENMMLMDDTTTMAALEDEDSAMIDVEALDPVPPVADHERTTVTETTDALGTITRRRRGVRAVTKRKTSRNERGYMVTEDIVVMEPFSEDEIIEAPAPAPARIEKPVSDAVSSKGNKSESGGPKKKAGGNQSLLNFFSKK
ncbi:DNA polymerase delta subunit 3 [Linnemannia exigua]|uniref:DNA polymerase delta subunit 3 n=1 Tax=Linnemannia exigua TaxID=604196 RepID=A0AAD4DAS8_9FUNG|nr:DNA polymerase delta subunit 3 [Linnemannia exigua]